MLSARWTKMPKVSCRHLEHGWAVMVATHVMQIECRSHVLPSRDRSTYSSSALSSQHTSISDHELVMPETVAMSTVALFFLTHKGERHTSRFREVCQTDVGTKTIRGRTEDQVSDPGRHHIYFLVHFSLGLQDDRFPLVFVRCRALTSIRY